MNDKDILDILDCIRNNYSFTTERTVDLIEKIMIDAKPKRIGDIIVNEVKRKRGRPKKTTNQEKMINSVKQNGDWFD